MKKNYFMLVSLVLLMALNATAQVSSVSDLFGKYKFTADVEFASDYEHSYGSILLSESDVTIEADAIYDGKIIGFAGSQQKLNIRAIEGNSIEMTNFNNPQLWSGLYMANGNGDHPNGVNEGGEWITYPYNTEYYTYNPDTKEITVPTFTVVKVSGSNVTVVATYKNTKLTYVGGNESEDSDATSFEWAGTHTLTATNVTAYDGKEYPATFDVTVAKNEAGYFVTNIMGYDVTALNSGGIQFTVAADGKSAQMATNSYLCGTYPDYIVIKDMNAGTTPINFELQNDGSIKVDNIYLQGFNYDTNATTALVYYEGITIAATGGSEPDESAFNWYGQHTVKIGAVESYDGKSYPTEFTMTVADVDGVPLVTEFYGNDVTGLNWGGIGFTIAEDGKSAEMATGAFVGGAYPAFFAIFDMNATTEPIRFVLNDDGSVTIDNFVLKTVSYDDGSETLAAYFQDVKIPAPGSSEPDVQEPFDWTGTWEVSATSVNSYDSKEYEDEFYMTIVFYPADEYNPAKYFITQFLSNNVADFNLGGIVLSVAEDNSTAEMETETLVGGAYPEYLKIYDMNGTTSPVIFTANEDGTMSIADFFVKNFDYTANAESPAVFYQGLTATKCPTGIDDIVVDNNVVKGIFDIQGRKIEQITVPGLYIIDGKKVLVK